MNWDLCCDVCVDLCLGNHEQRCFQYHFPTWCVLTKGHSRDLWLMKRFYYDCNDVLWITGSHQPYTFFLGCLVLLRIWGPQKGGYMWIYNQEFMQLWTAKPHKTIRYCVQTNGDLSIVESICIWKPDICGLYLEKVKTPCWMLRNLFGILIVQKNWSTAFSISTQTQRKLCDRSPNRCREPRLIPRVNWVDTQFNIPPNIAII